MIIAAGIAAQAATALAQALQGKNRSGASGSPTTDFSNLTADIGALLPGGGSAGGNGAGSGTGSIGGDLSSLGSDLLGSLGLGATNAPPSPSAAAQAYAAANTLAS